MAHLLHHIALGARDVERVAAFYRDVFRLAELARHTDDQGALRSIWLDLGGPILMVEFSSEARPPVNGVGPGPFLLAFAIGPGERTALEMRLASAGAPTEERTAFTSYARDPEGNRIAISHYPDAAHPRGQVSS